MRSTPSIHRENVAGAELDPLAGVTGVDPRPSMGDVHHGLAHTVSPLILIGVFAALMVLTLITVAVTKIDFGYNANLIIALSIALVKAILVVAYFMHLRYDSLFYTVIVGLSLLFIVLFIGFTIIDTGQYAPVLHPVDVKPA